jgi:hypothetical protein
MKVVGELGQVENWGIAFLFSPWAFRNSLLVRPIAYVFSTTMLLKGCGSILATLRGHTAGSVHFTGTAARHLFVPSPSCRVGLPAAPVAIFPLAYLGSDSRAINQGQKIATWWK